MSENFKLYINGEWCDADDGNTLGIINPATEEVIREIPYGGRAETRRALEAAAAAFDDWRSRTAYERAEHLMRVGALIRERVNDIARLLTTEQGKTLGESRAEILQAAATFEWFAEEGKRAYGRIIPPSAPGKRHWVIRHPVGVAAAITPWNFPIALQSRKIGPALAAGCTTVSRPASQTPLATMAMFQCLHDAGFPPGTVNLVCGPAEEMADELFTNPICKKVSFTGSTEVGKQLIRRSADQVKKLELELGGHAPVLIFEDADVDAAAKTAAIGKFRNNGQVCIAPTRFYAQERIYKDFIEATVEVTRALKLGNGLDPDTDIGPMFERSGMERTETFIADATSKGATLLIGGGRAKQFEKGYFFEPTVLTDIQPTMRLTCEETFGPVMPLMSFNSVEEAVEVANHPTYGLAAYVITRDLSTAIRVAEGLEYGIIGINDPVPATPQCPFGGMKESGLGRELGLEGLEEYLETKYVSLAI